MLLPAVMLLFAPTVSHAQSAAKADGSAVKQGSAAKEGSEAKKMGSDIVDTAVAAGTFETLVAAAKAGGLVNTLKSPGPLTVFAPSDDAFKKLPAGTVESLLKPENLSKLQSILKYHVIGGKIMSSDIKNIQNAQTAEGNSVTVSVTDDGVMIDGAKVVKADIECSNGVIHVIDSVIMPGYKPAGSMKKEGSMEKKGSEKKGSGSK